MKKVLILTAAVFGVSTTAAPAAEMSWALKLQVRACDVYGCLETPVKVQFRTQKMCDDIRNDVLNGKTPAARDIALPKPTEQCERIQ
jgi:hypothetical protein